MIRTTASYLIMIYKVEVLSGNWSLVWIDLSAVCKPVISIDKTLKLYPTLCLRYNATLLRWGLESMTDVETRPTDSPRWLPSKRIKPQAQANFKTPTPTVINLQSHLVVARHKFCPTFEKKKPRKAAVACISLTVLSKCSARLDNSLDQ